MCVICNDFAVNWRADSLEIVATPSHMHPALTNCQKLPIQTQLFNSLTLHWLALDVNFDLYHSIKSTGGCRMRTFPYFRRATKHSITPTYPSQPVLQHRGLLVRAAVFQQKPSAIPDHTGIQRRTTTLLGVLLGTRTRTPLVAPLGTPLTSWQVSCVKCHLLTTMTIFMPSFHVSIHFQVSGEHSDGPSVQFHFSTIMTIVIHQF